MVPGLWLTPAQAYAFLTLHNMVEKIAPNVLGPFLMPMRGLLKQMLGEADFPLHGLDRKIEIDMPAMPAIGDLDFSNLVEALIQEQPARFVIRTKSGTRAHPVRHAAEAAHHGVGMERPGAAPLGSRAGHGQRRGHPQGHGGDARATNDRPAVPCSLTL